MVFIDPTEFRILGQILDRFFIGRGITFTKDPTHVRPPETS